MIGADIGARVLLAGMDALGAVSIQHHRSSVGNLFGDKGSRVVTEVDPLTTLGVQ